MGFLLTTTVDDPYISLSFPFKKALKKDRNPLKQAFKKLGLKLFYILLSISSLQFC